MVKIIGIINKFINKNKSHRLGTPFLYKERYYVILDNYSDYNKDIIPDSIYKEALKLIDNNVKFYASFDICEGYGYSSNLVKSAYNGVYPGNGKPLKLNNRGVMSVPDWFYHINSDSWINMRGDNSKILYSLCTIVFEEDKMINHD